MNEKDYTPENATNNAKDSNTQDSTNLGPVIDTDINTSMLVT